MSSSTQIKRYSTFVVEDSYQSASHRIRYPILLTFCVLCFSVSWLSFTFLSFPVEYSFFKITLHAQNIPVISYIIFSFPSLWIIHRCTIQQILLTSAILSFSGTLLRYILFNFYIGVIISSVICSISLTLISPLPSLISALFFDEGERAKATALETICILLGVIVGLPSKPIDEDEDTTKRLSIYLMIQSIFSLLVLILVWMVMNNKKYILSCVEDSADTRLENMNNNKSLSTIPSIPENAKQRDSLCFQSYRQSYSSNIFDGLDYSGDFSKLLDTSILDQNENSLFFTYSADFSKSFLNPIQPPTFCENVCNYFATPILFHYTVSYGAILSVLFSMIELSFFETWAISFPVGCICCLILAILLDTSTISLASATHSLFISCAFFIISFYLYPEHLMPKTLLAIIFVPFLFIGYIYSSNIKLILDDGDTTMEVQNRFSTGFLIYYSIVFYWIITCIFRKISDITDDDEKVVGWTHVYLLMIVWIWFVSGVMVD